MARARQRMGALSPQQAEALEKATAAIVNKLLHPPMVCLGDMAREDQSDARASLVRRVFGLG